MKSSDYSKFSYINGNRNIIANHLKHLTASISQNDLLESNPIIVNEKFQIIDGQHRFEAAKSLGLQIHYIIREGARLPEVIILNSINKSWGLEDYLHSHIQRGKKDYELIKLFCDTYNIPISLALSLMSKETAKGDNIRDFKDGTYTVTKLKQAEDIAEQLIAYKPYTEQGVYRSRDFIRAIAYLYKNKLINQRTMFKKLTIRGIKIVKTATIKDMYRQLEDIYNYKTMEKNKVRFF